MKADECKVAEKDQSMRWPREQLTGSGTPFPEVIFSYNALKPWSNSKSCADYQSSQTESNRLHQVIDPNIHKYIPYNSRINEFLNVLSASNMDLDLEY